VNRGSIGMIGVLSSFFRTCVFLFIAQKSPELHILSKLDLRCCDFLAHDRRWPEGKEHGMCAFSLPKLRRPNFVGIRLRRACTDQPTQTSYGSALFLLDLTTCVCCVRVATVICGRRSRLPKVPLIRSPSGTEGKARHLLVFIYSAAR
jgi:hypothetical protein